LAEPLTANQQSSMSLLGLNDILVPVDQLSSEGIAVQTLEQPELLVKGALRGTLESLEIGFPPRSGRSITTRKRGPTAQPTRYGF
jgi:hypothetical protein